MDEEYTPVNAPRASARRHRSGLRDQSLDIIGVIDSDAITSEDLRAGYYRDAQITEHVVDWRYSWAGPFSTTSYWIGEVQFDGESWVAELRGISSWLGFKIGDVYGRTCRWDLGEGHGEATRAGCKVDLASLTKGPISVDDVPTAGSETRIFDADAAELGSGYGDGYFVFGQVDWITGANAGLTSEVKAYTESSRRFELHLNLPFDIEDGDQFEVAPGCDKLFTTCQSKFNEYSDTGVILTTLGANGGNYKNFGGFPHIPGTDKTLQSPRR